jgi:hypothetical protein
MSYFKTPGLTKLGRNQKSQSAIEFITTYGWALVIIVVVLAALYNVGLFSGNAFTGTSCIAQVGFLCSNPVLNSSGAVTVQFGESVGQITIQGIGCSNSTSVPPLIQPLQSQQQMQQGSIIKMNFWCAIKSPNLGTTFIGALWINYTNQYGQKIQTAISKISVKVSSVQSTGSGAVNPFQYLFVPITITNSQSSATGSIFQQMITFNPSSYSSHEANDLGNIRFYEGAVGTNELYSWCESGCTSSSPSAIFWVDIQNGIGSTNSVLVNMSFNSNLLTEYDGVYAGEAPELTCPNSNTMICGSIYAKYDNGATVFPALYVNFVGTSLPGGWSWWSTNTNFGFVANGLYMLGNTAWNSGTWAPAITEAGNVLDTYMTYNVPGTDGGNVDFGYDTAYEWDGMVAWSPDSSAPTDLLATCCYSLTWGTLHPSNTLHVYSVYWPGTTSAIFAYDYVNSETLTKSGLATGNAGEGFQFDDAAFGSSITDYWMRERTEPPANVMPAATFGTLT